MRRFAQTSLVGSVVAVLVAALAAAGCTPPEAPANPRWDTDVYPLLRGSCLHCHGETAKVTAPGFRFDFCNAAALKDLGVDIGVGAASPTINALLLLYVQKPKEAPDRMPPPPAATLSDYDLTLLKNWQAAVSKAGNDVAGVCSKQGSNHPPKAVLVGQLHKDGNDLKATLDVSDPDDDQVVGKANVPGGSDTGVIPALGRHEITIPNGGSSDKIEVKLSDGYAPTVTLTLP